MSEGVEWAAHCCLLLDWIGDADPVPTAQLAAAFELPPPYLNKQLQALVRAGILTSTRGKRGGFALGRALDRITLLDVVDAIEGPDPAFRCTEIRRPRIQGLPQRIFGSEVIRRSPERSAGPEAASAREVRKAGVLSGHRGGLELGRIRLAPQAGAANGRPQPLAWNIGTTISTRSSAVGPITSACRARRV